ncbi:MAG: hypothetical protein ABGW50_06680 [Thermococcus sp.]
MQDGGNAPKQGVGEGVENERRGTETKGKTRVEKELIEPVKTKKRPLARADGAKTEGMLNIEFGQKRDGTCGAHEGNGIVKGAIGDREFGGIDRVVDGAGMRVR